MVVVSTQRVVALVVLLVLGVLSLPLVAAVLDGEGTENWILPVQLLLMAAIGALVGRMVPALAGPGATRAPGMLVGARRRAWPRPCSASSSSSCC